MSVTYSIVHDLLTGFPAAVSGRAWFYLPGTSTITTIFGDDTGTSISNPVTLDSNGSARVYLSQLARMLVQDVNGATIADTVINKEGVSAVVNTSAAFTATTQEGVNNSALTAFGGQNYTYVPSGAWPGMLPKDWMNGVFRNVKAYGAKGDGVTLDDTAIAAAVADVAAANGGIVYFPPGTYLVSGAISLTSKAGVSFQGAGQTASIIKTTSGSVNVFALTTCSGFSIRGIGITATGTNSGIAISLPGCFGYIVDSVTIGTSGGGTFLVCAAVSGAASKTAFSNCLFTAKAADAAARGISYSPSGGASGHVISACSIDGGSGQPVTFDGATSQVAMYGCLLTGSLTFTATLSGSGFNIVGNYFGSNVTVSATTDLILFQAGNRWTAQVLNFAVGTAQTPDVSSGTSHLSATSGGAGAVTINTLVPPLGVNRNTFYLELTGASGGNVTFNFAAAYKLNGGSPIVVTNGTTTVLGLKLDLENGGYREVSRVNSTT